MGTVRGFDREIPWACIREVGLHDHPEIHTFAEAFRMRRDRQNNNVTVRLAAADAD